MNVHLVKITQTELQDFSPFPVLTRDVRPYKIGDLYVLDIFKDEGKDHSGTQVIYTIESAFRAGDKKGIKAGFVMLKLKRTSLNKIFAEPQPSIAASSEDES